MIVVTRLNGPALAVNPDLVQRIEATPDTVITLVDGTKYIVEESLDDVISSVLDFRAKVILRVQELGAEPPNPEREPRPRWPRAVETPEVP